MKIIYNIIIFIFVLLTIDSCQIKRYDINNQKKEIFSFLDTCLTEQIKDSIIITDENKFSRYNLNASNIDLSWTDFRKYHKCFDYIDTLIHKKNGEYIDIFKDFPDDFNISISEIISKSYCRYLKKLPDKFNYYIDSLWKLKLWSDSLPKAWAVADTINGFYIPKDIEDTYTQIYILFDSSRILKFIDLTDEEYAVAYEHHNLGMTLRAIWKLGGSRLHNNFRKKYGITNHDLISSFILRCWYRYLNNKPINYDELIIKYKEYQKLND